MSDMEEYLWALEVKLSDALEREKLLTSDLRAAQSSAEELQSRAAEYKIKYQRLDDALEAEEAKTSAERLAREAAEETTREHCATVLKSKQNEAIAVQHCEAAESEVIDLQMTLSVERSATATASNLANRLQEDLELAEANERAAYDLLDAARVKVSDLQRELLDAANNLNILKGDARELEEMVQRENQRATEAENSLDVVVSELESNEIRFSDLLERYNALEAKQGERDCTRCKSATMIYDTDSVDVQSPVGIQHTTLPDSERLPLKSTDFCRNLSETTLVDSAWSTAKSHEDSPMDLPALPEPAVLRPALASVAADHVEVLSAKGRLRPARRTTAKKPRRRCLWRFPKVNTMQLLFGGVLDVEVSSNAYGRREERSWALPPPDPGR